MIVALNFIALPDERGSGAFHYIRNLLAVMGEYTLRGTHFIVYKQQQISDAYIGMPSNADVEYINVPTLGNGWKRIIFEQTRFYRYIKPCDVFYSYCTSLPLYVQAKRIFTLHDVYYLTNPERYGWLQRTYLKFITRLYARRVDEILTVSYYSQGQIEGYIPAARGKVRMTHNSLPEYCAEEQEVAIEPKPFFLFVGSVQPSKNIVRTVQAFVQFNQAHQYQLLVVGKPLQNSQVILDQIAGIPDVHYLGYMPDEKVTYLYKRTEAVVLFSLCEGFGIPPLEGFRFGKPALTANTTSLPEVVGEAGIQVDPLDINEMAAGFQKVLDQRDRLVQHTQEQIDKFDRHTACETWMKSLQIDFSK